VFKNSAALSLPPLSTGWPSQSSSTSKELVNYPNRGAELVARLPIENQVLFDFFENALSALESFCFSSYYVGVGIDGTKFDINKKPIDPAEVLRRFQIFEPTEGFTVTLSGLPGFVGNDRAQGHEKYAAPQACARAGHTAACSRFPA
jgi:hypothetical protein